LKSEKRKEIGRGKSHILKCDLKKKTFGVESRQIAEGGGNIEEMC